MVRPNSFTSNELVGVVIKGMQEVKGKEITTIDLRKIPNAVCDYFIICHGSSDRQVEAIAESVEREVKKTLDEMPVSREGITQSQWIILDYFNVVVHVFQKECRDYYGIEKLWADADVKEIAYRI